MRWLPAPHSCRNRGVISPCHQRMSQKGFSSGQGYRPEQVVMLQLMQNDTSEGAADSVKPHYSNALKVAAMLSIATCGYDHCIMLSWLASASKQASSPRASIRHTVPGRSDARGQCPTVVAL